MKHNAFYDANLLDVNRLRRDIYNQCRHAVGDVRRIALAVRVSSNVTGL